jgi:diacylglycerol kinase family enzyme
MAVETTRWGILYCPKAGISNKKKRWERLQQVLDERHVDYDFVQSENAESVERLMTMLVNNGYKTIVVVGGDSALNDAANCLMAQPRQVRDSIALGVIPNGVMNDFAKFWELDEDELEQTVETLKARRVRRIDLGCIHYTNKEGQSCHRYFLNCVNVGLAASIMNLRRQTRRFFGSQTLSLVSTTLLLAFQRLDYKMNVQINEDRIERRVMTMCIGSARGYGQTPNAVPYNGLLDVSVVYHPGVTQLIEGLYMLFTGRFLNHKSVHPYRTREVAMEVDKHTLVGIDGRMMRTPVGKMTVDIHQEVVNFIIP